MSSPGERKRKANDSGGRHPDDDGRSPLSPVLRAPRRRANRPVPGGANYFIINCRSLMQQHIEALNQEFSRYYQEHAGEEMFWHHCEYLRRLRAYKRLYQKLFTGSVLTCGSNDMEQLGIPEREYNYPRRVRIADNDKVFIACGAAHNVMLDFRGRAFTFGSSDEAQTGRGGADNSGNLQVTGFFPSAFAGFRTPPVPNEDECIIMVAAGPTSTLFLSMHGNVYVVGCLRDYQDHKFREHAPSDDLRVDPNKKQFPHGKNYHPVHVYQLGKRAKDVACGTFMNAAILEDDTLVTWGTGTMGELGRHVPKSYSHIDEIVDDEDGKKKTVTIYHEDKLRDEFLKPHPVQFQGPQIRRLVISVACGQAHLMVVAREAGGRTMDSIVYGSGVNKDGQLGLGDMENRKILTPLEDTKTLMIAEVKCGLFHTLALDLSRTRLLGCGRQQNGQLGLTDGYDDDPVTRLTPIPFPKVGLVFGQVECGEEHSLAIAKPPGGGTEVYTWGYGDPSGALGHESDTSEYRAKLLDFRRKDESRSKIEGVWRGVAGGAQHSAFLFTPAGKKPQTES